MKVATICFFIMSICASCHITEDNNSLNSVKTMTRNDEILRIMREYWIRELENNAYWLSALERDELRRMKKDYYYVSDPNLELNIPGPEWGIRGPLTIEQVEQGSLEEIKKFHDVPQVPFGFQNDKWNKLKSQFKEGDELYLFGSKLTRGYALIHKNKVIDIIVTNVS